MMKKILLFTLFGSLFFAQQKENIVYNEYPTGTDFYDGGVVKFYKDIHDVIVKEKIESCKNKKELYKVNFIVYPDGKIKFVKDIDPLKTEQNKCAFELSRKTFKFLNKWNSAVVSGEKVAAMASAYIYPDDLFSNYSEGYDILYYFTPPVFAEGGNSFRNQFAKNLNFRGVRFNQFIVNVAIHFDVDEMGKMTNFRMKPGSGDEEVDEMFMKSIKWIKGKWIPATIHGINVEATYKFPIVLNEN
ncbi:energy transducer TonB [Elizabethkingia miricola]|uniref:energy transducer TonB n=2 Tax=Weeksellaceae TaxID=2762318 RepID=UPI00389188BF